QFAKVSLSALASCSFKHRLEARVGCQQFGVSNHGTLHRLDNLTLSPPKVWHVVDRQPPVRAPAFGKEERNGHLVEPVRQLDVSKIPRVNARQAESRGRLWWQETTGE